MNSLGLFLAGITDSYNPCSIGVLLISLAFLVSLRKKHLISLFGISYLSTIFLTYFLIGLGMLKAFHIFGVHGFFGYVAGVILILIGLIHLLPGVFNRISLLKWLNSCHIPLNIEKHLDKGVFTAGIILGFLIGLCTVPCAGGIYMGAIALLATKTSYWQGIFGIFLFNIGFILPLLFIFILASREKFLRLIHKILARTSAISNYIISIIMILMGIILLFLANR
ncbi:MAG: cytochrome c biosis transrane protein [Candidatus Berkelbacteria bacterium]|nr:cytochrome c biosis transrane protein [Candidatus Berkelbacteria bacterium]